MLTVVIATLDSERALVRSLAALVAGAVEGVVREVIVADAGSSDATGKVADIAGAHFAVMQQPLGGRLKSAAAMARGTWLLFLQPGTVLDPTWVDDASQFMRDSELEGQTSRLAAVFRPGGNSGRRRHALVEALVLASATLWARPRPAQGLLIAKSQYDALGGHRPDISDSEVDLLRRIGGRHIVTLRSAAVMSDGR